MQKIKQYAKLWEVTKALKEPLSCLFCVTFISPTIQACWHQQLQKWYYKGIRFQENTLAFSCLKTANHKSKHQVSNTVYKDTCLSYVLRDPQDKGFWGFYFLSCEAFSSFHSFDERTQLARASIRCKAHSVCRTVQWSTICHHCVNPCNTTILNTNHKACCCLCQVAIRRTIPDLMRFTCHDFNGIQAENAILILDDWQISATEFVCSIF